MPDWVEETTSVAVFPAPPPPPGASQQPAVQSVEEPLRKVYIRNLHGDTNQQDLVSIVATLTFAPVHRPFISNLHKGKRWAKFDIAASVADDVIDRFNFVSGVLHGQAEAEHARS